MPLLIGIYPSKCSRVTSDCVNETAQKRDIAIQQLQTSHANSCLHTSATDAATPQVMVRTVT